MTYIKGVLPKCRACLTCFWFTKQRKSSLKYDSYQRCCGFGSHGRYNLTLWLVLLDENKRKKKTLSILKGKCKNNDFLLIKMLLKF